MMLHVLRHGIAEDAAPGGDDRARRLTPEGRAKLRGAAAGMRALGIEPGALLTSPLVRARETADIVADVLACSRPEILAALAAGVAPADTVRALRPYLRHEQVMIVGHEPGLGRTVSFLLTGSADAVTVVLKKGGLVALELESLPPRGSAALRWMLAPRQLRDLGK